MLNQFISEKFNAKSIYNSKTKISEIQKYLINNNNKKEFDKRK